MEHRYKLFYSDYIQRYDNKKYPHEIDIVNIKTLTTATSFDYVCARYKDNLRSNDNFISSNCVVFDFDNDHSNKEDDWITPDDIKNIFIDVPYLVHFSKSHMKEKGEFSPRPRFHIIFPIDECTSADEYRNLKLRVHEYLPLVDKNALDSARFMAGTNNPLVEIHNEGNTTLNKFLDYIYEDEAKFAKFDNEPKEIIQGSRNDTMHKIAVKRC